jgi:hypothetical protein
MMHAVFSNAPDKMPFRFNISVFLDSNFTMYSIPRVDDDASLVAISRVPSCWSALIWIHWGQSPFDVMAMFDSIVLQDYTTCNDPPPKLTSIDVRYANRDTELFTKHTMYKLDNDEPCALDSAVRDIAATKINRVAKECMARRRFKCLLHAALAEIVYAPPGAYVNSFPGGVEYEVARTSFYFTH